MDFAALSKMAKDATTKAKATATKLAEQAKERLEAVSYTHLTLPTILLV